jgi:hypothetical protein
MGPARDPFYVRYAWLPLFVLGLLAAVTSLGYIAIGLQEVPDSPVLIAEGRVSTAELLAHGAPQMITVFQQTMREWGIWEGVLGLMVAALAAGPLRRGERWAWYTLWLFPAGLALSYVNLLLSGAFDAPGEGDAAFIWWALLFIVAVSSLLLATPRVFGRRELMRQESST